MGGAALWETYTRIKYLNITMLISILYLMRSQEVCACVCVCVSRGVASFSSWGVHFWQMQQARRGEKKKKVFS